MKKLLGALGVLAVIFAGCSSQQNSPPNAPQTASNRVVLYCSVDDVYARPLIAELEKKTGLEIDPLFDTEAAKTAGLANRIRAEKSRPQGDVFWSSALLQTLLLEREGLFEPYISPSAKNIPAAFKAKNGSWTGLGVRARVVVDSRSVVACNEVGSPGFPSFFCAKSIAISNPQFGTGSDWVAALTARNGLTATTGYFRNLKEKNVRVLPGNSVVAEKVARGEIEAGVTDTDDYYVQRPKAKKSYQMDLANPYVVLVPGSVAILKNSPRLTNARVLVDALLTLENEQRLVNTMPGVAPLRANVTPKLAEMRELALRVPDSPNDTHKWPTAWDEIREPLAQILLSE